MSVPTQVNEKEWEVAIKVRSTLDLFNFLSRSFLAKESLPVKKLEKVEFIVKP